MECKYCKAKTIKAGKQKSGIQKWFCKPCSKYQQADYCYNACNPTINKQITNQLVEGSGIRSISRLLNISPTTVLSRILSISQAIKRPNLSFNKTYQVDEMCTFIGNKKNKYWIVYALRKGTKQVVGFAIGKRTNKTLKRVVDTLLLSNPKRINTDKLKNYKTLIPAAIHKTKQFGINHIERKNLSLRTHLKRLNRRTICFSRSLPMLSACLKIYFWGKTKLIN